MAIICDGKEEDEQCSHCTISLPISVFSLLSFTIINCWVVQEAATDGTFVEVCALQGIQWAYHLLLHAALMVSTALQGIQWAYNLMLHAALMVSTAFYVLLGIFYLACVPASVWHQPAQ